VTVAARKKVGAVADWRSWKLIVRDLAVERGDRRVLDHVSFTVGCGEAVVLRGPNGTGKTTLIRAIAGLLPAAAGEIDLEGRPDDAPVGTYCHYIAHRNALKGDLSVRENLLFWKDISGDRSSPFDAISERVDLADLADIPVRYLSAGQQRRVALARLLVSPRPLWLLDEPTVSLDQSHTELFAGLANEHLADGGMIVAATHLPLGFRGERVLRLAAESRDAERERS
jgi:heme exporter protein A